MIGRPGPVSAAGDHRSKIAITQRIEYTGFLLEVIELYFANETLYLPGEH